MHLVNYITLSRIILGPIFLVIYSGGASLQFGSKDIPYLLIALLCISELTDFIDGFLARKYQQVTDLGKILDPMADSIFRLSVFLTFTMPPINLPLWLIFFIFYRELIVSGLRTVCSLKGFALAARASGKIKAIIQGLACMVILILFVLYTDEKITLQQLQLYSFYCALIAAVYTVISGIEYLYVNRVYIGKALQNSNTL